MNQIHTEAADPRIATKAHPAIGPTAEEIRACFPILDQQVHERDLVYLDSAASSQKPQVVIDAIRSYYEQHNSNIHRGVHSLSQRATELYEGAREQVRSFLGAAESREIIFTRGTTESINLVANSLGLSWKPGDEVVLSTMEHHSNIVPWQLLRDRVGIKLRVAPINDAGELDMDAFSDLLGPRTKLVSIAHASNALGTVNPVEQIVRLAHERNIPVLLDGAQAAPHLPVDVQALGVDFYAFSGHKVYGPTGIGVLYGRAAMLEHMTPWQGGGDMILQVRFEKSSWNALPYKFEAGTPNIAGGVGLGAALAWLQGIGMSQVAARERDLLTYGTAQLEQIEGLRLLGTAAEKVGVLSFLLNGVHPHDIGTILDQCGVAIRAGHHCAQPVMQRFGIPATARASLGIYNNRDDIDRLVAGIERAQEIFG